MAISGGHLCQNKIKKTEFRTANFKETPWKQSQDILVNGQRFGTLEVYYLVPKPASDEGLFLEEERNLIRIIAQRLGLIIEGEHAEANMELMYVRERELRKKPESEIKMRADTFAIPLTPFPHPGWLRWGWFFPQSWIVRNVFGFSS